MKRSVLTLTLAWLVCGCASRMNSDVLQARIREQSVQLTESQREVAKTRAELKQVRREADRLRAELGETHPTGGVARMPADISKVHIYSLLSGGINKDTQPGDDVVVVQFAPFDRDNEPINVPGDVELTLLDPQLPDSERELGHWSFSAEECRKQWTRGIANSGFQFTLPLEEAAQHTDLVVQVQYTTANDRQYETSRVVKVALASADVAAHTRRQRKKPVQVVEDSDDDLPPVGDFRSKTADLDVDDSELDDVKIRSTSSQKPLLDSTNWTDATIPSWR